MIKYVQVWGNPGIFIKNKKRAEKITARFTPSLFATHLFSKILMEVRDSFYPFIIIINIVLLIRAVQVVIVQPHAHKHNLHPQFSFQDGADGYTAAAAHRYGCFTEGGFHGLGRSLVPFAVNGVR